MHLGHCRRMLVLMGVPQAEQYFWFGLGFLVFMLSVPSDPGSLGDQPSWRYSSHSFSVMT
jgi:hypothetical protein